MNTTKRLATLAGTAAGAVLLLATTITPAYGTLVGKYPDNLGEDLSVPTSTSPTPANYDTRRPLDRTTVADVRADDTLDPKQKRQCRRVLTRLNRVERTFWSFTDTYGNFEDAARNQALHWKKTDGKSYIVNNKMWPGQAVNKDTFTLWKLASARYLELADRCTWQNAPRIPSGVANNPAYGTFDDTTMPLVPFAPKVAYTYPDIKKLLASTTLPQRVQDDAMRRFTQMAGGYVALSNGPDDKGQVGFLMDVRTTNHSDAVVFSFQVIGTGRIGIGYFSRYDWTDRGDMFSSRLDQMSRTVPTWVQFTLADFGAWKELAPCAISFSSNAVKESDNNRPYISCY